MILLRKLLKQATVGGVAGVALAVFSGAVGGFLMLEAIRALLNLDGLFAQPVLNVVRDIFESVLEKAPGTEKEAHAIFLNPFWIRVNAANYLFGLACIVFLLADKFLSKEDMKD